MIFKTQTFLYICSCALMLTSCSQMTMQSKESMDATEFKPWRSEEDTMGAMVDQPGKRITPHIGFSIPIEDDHLEIAKSRLQKKLKKSAEKTDIISRPIKTIRDPQHHTIKIVSVESNYDR